MKPMRIEIINDILDAYTWTTKLWRPPVSTSPFVVGRPLRANERIFGRDADLRYIGEQLNNNSCVNLVAERRMGKTSLINHLVSHPEKYIQAADPALILVRIDLQGNISNEHAFYGTALRELLRQLPEDHSREGRDFRQLLRNLHQTPTTSYNQFQQVLHELHDADDIHVRPVFVIDEFEKLLEARDGFPYPDFYNGLRSLIGDQVVLMNAVIASRLPLIDYFRDPNRPKTLTSTFPTYFPPHHLRELHPGDADALLLQDGVLTTSEAHEARQWAGTHPCHLQAAGAAIYDMKISKKTYPEARQHYQQLLDQSCDTGQRQHNGQNRLPAIRRTVFSIPRWIVIDLPIRIGRVVKFFGGRLSDMTAWILGILFLVILVLCLIGFIAWSDIVSHILNLLGLTP